MPTPEDLRVAAQAEEMVNRRAATQEEAIGSVLSSAADRIGAHLQFQASQLQAFHDRTVRMLGRRLAAHDKHISDTINPIYALVQSHLSNEQDTIRAAQQAAAEMPPVLQSAPAQHGSTGPVPRSHFGPPPKTPPVLYALPPVPGGPKAPPRSPPVLSCPPGYTLQPDGSCLPILPVIPGGPPVPPEGGPPESPVAECPVEIHPSDLCSLCDCIEAAAHGARTPVDFDTPRAYLFGERTEEWERLADNWMTNISSVARAYDTYIHWISDRKANSSPSQGELQYPPPEVDRGTWLLPSGGPLR